MAKPDFEYERCLVRILRNDKVVGTGFVIGSGQVLTCAHVVAADSKRPPKSANLAIDFYAAETTEGASGTASSRTTPTLTNARKATIHTKYFSPKDEYDVAVLSFEGDLPRGVHRATFSSQSKLADTPIRTRGFPKLGDCDCQAGTGTIVGRATYRGRDHELSLRSNEIKGSFSGAPLFRTSSGVVVGMVCAIARPDGDWRDTETAFALSCESIRAVCDELLHSIESKVEAEHETAIKRLKNDLVKVLQKNDVATSELAKVLEIPSNTSSSERFERIAERLISDQTSVTELADWLIPLHQKLLERPNRLAAQCVLDAYWTVLSAIIDPEMMKRLRGLTQEGERTLVIPASSRTIVGVLMAGLDGRRGEFHAPATRGDEPCSKHEIPLPPERGYSQTSASGTSDQRDTERILNVVEDALQLKLGNLEPDVRLARLRSMLDGKARRNESYFVVSVHAKPADARDWNRFREYFKSLYLIEMSKADEAVVKRDSDALEFLLACDPLPAKPKKKRTR